MHWRSVQPKLIHRRSVQPKLIHWRSVQPKLIHWNSSRKPRKSPTTVYREGMRYYVPDPTGRLRLAGQGQLTMKHCFQP